MSSEKLPQTTLPILLAGGEGTRLRPITSDRPKPLIPVDGIPAICRILDTLAAIGANRAVITVRYRAEDIVHALGTDYAGIRLSYSNETDAPRGTAGGVRDAWDAFSKPTDTDALIISGDAVFTCDLIAFSAFHRKVCADASLLCVSVPDPGAFGIVNMDETGRITSFSEKPCAAETLSDTVNTGIYCLTRAFLETIPKDGAPDFGQDIFPQALHKGSALYAYESTDYWCDVGSFSDYLACSLDVSSGKIRGMITPRMHPVLPPHIADCSVGRECFIPSTASVRGSILFDRVAIGSGASVSGSIICDSVHIGSHTVVEPGCVIGSGCHIGDCLHLPRGTRLEPGTHLHHPPQSAQNGFPATRSARDAFGGGALLTPYLSDIGYLLSVDTRPEPETAVAFARALAAYAEKQHCALFLCRAEDTPSLHSLLLLTAEVLACIESKSSPIRVFCTDDDVLPLSAARMPSLPLPDRSADPKLLRVVFLRRGRIPAAALFDETGLYPTRKEERILDTCFSDALSAQYRSYPTSETAEQTTAPEMIRVRSEDLLSAYISKYARGSLSPIGITPFAFSCGSTPAERLLSRLLCAMGGEETVSAPIHFSVRQPNEDDGDILCPLTVTDLRQLKKHGQPVGYSHWTLFSLLIAQSLDSLPTEHFPTPRYPDPSAKRQPLSVPICAPMDLHAEFRYSHAPVLSDHAAADNVPALSRRYAAMEAEDALLLARDIAILLSEHPQPLGAWMNAADTMQQPHPICRCHGLAVSHPDPAHPLTLSANLSPLMRGEASQTFRPAVEGVIHQRGTGSVRVVATRDHNFRIIADAYSTEAAEELFQFAKDKLLRTVNSAQNG